MWAHERFCSKYLLNVAVGPFSLLSIWRGFRDEVLYPSAVGSLTKIIAPSENSSTNVLLSIYFSSLNIAQGAPTIFVTL